MKSAVYRARGESQLISIEERPEPSPEPGEVAIRVRVSGVNPTDWKQRHSWRPEPAGPAFQVPNQDGSGIVVSMGAGADGLTVGDRVWLWDAAWRRAEGTAQEVLCLPRRQAVRLPADASFDLGASLGIPALTAHLVLTGGSTGPEMLGPKVLSGATVLVHGGAGAVGHAAIQLAAWAGATVLATVSSPYKAVLAAAAGAHHVIDYARAEPVAAVRDYAPHGVDVIAEVNPAANAAIDAAVIRPGGAVTGYAGGMDPVHVALGGGHADVTVRSVLTYTASRDRKDAAINAVSAAVAAGVLSVGTETGLPLHRYSLESTGAAHDAVQQGAIGKVLIDVASE
jgi:NADPH:quinone reductase